MTNESWMAVQSAPRHEKRVEALLAYRGYRCFLPVVKSVRKWSDRSARIDVPLFPSYLYCKASATAFAPMITTPRVIRLVGAGRLPPAREAPCGRSSRSRSTAARPAPRSATETSFRPECSLAERLRISARGFAPIDASAPAEPIPHCFRQTARRFASKVAVRTHQWTLTYADLDDLFEAATIENLAGALTGQQRPADPGRPLWAAAEPVRTLSVPVTLL